MPFGDCAPITLVGETSVSGSLQAMDCHINDAVQIGYDRLFGPGGAFGGALKGMLVIYVLLLGYGFLTGRTRLTLVMMSPRLVTMILVLTFVSVWPAYHAVFYGLLMGGPDEVAAALLGQRGSAVMNFAQNLDGLFVSFADIARRLDGSRVITNPNDPAMIATLLASKSVPVTLFWLSGLFLLVSTLGVLILTRMVLYLLLILGPVFIIFALFSQTRGLFNGWLRTSLVFALAPLLTVLGGTAALMLFVPLLDSIGRDPMAAVKAVQPMVILFMGSTIYCAFLFTLMWVSGSLVRDWQAALRDKSIERGMDTTPGIQPLAAMTGPGAPMLNLRTGAAGSSESFERTGALVTAMTRDSAQGGNGGSARTDVLGLYDPQSRGLSPSASADRFSRVQGLGQRFRPVRTEPLRTETTS